jgi:hypothetical protein
MAPRTWHDLPRRRRLAMRLKSVKTHKEGMRPSKRVTWPARAGSSTISWPAAADASGDLLSRFAVGCCVKFTSAPSARGEQGREPHCMVFERSRVKSPFRLRVRACTRLGRTRGRTLVPSERRRRAGPRCDCRESRSSFSGASFRFANVELRWLAPFPRRPRRDDDREYEFAPDVDLRLNAGHPKAFRLCQGFELIHQDAHAQREVHGT